MGSALFGASGIVVQGKIVARTLWNSSDGGLIKGSRVDIQVPAPVPHTHACVLFIPHVSHQEGAVITASNASCSNSGCLITGGRCNKRWRA
jgi:hypothetical protein